jgi:hypothetical protein
LGPAARILTITPPRRLSGNFISGFASRAVHSCHVSLARATSPTNLILLGLVTSVVVKKYKYLDTVCEMHREMSTGAVRAEVGIW